MQIRLRQSIAPFATVVMMVGIAVFTGCEKKPEVYTSRADDPAYTKALEESRKTQGKQAAERARIAAQLQQHIDRARASLPANATDEQIMAEIEKNPQKYPGWKPLKAALDKADVGIKEELAKVRNTVRARILKEAADNKAVEQGRAVGKAAAK